MPDRWIGHLQLHCVVCDRHHSAHRNDREDEQGGQESQVRRQLEPRNGLPDRAAGPP